MAFCKDCGNKLSDGSKFCDKCGANVGAVAATAKKPTAASKPRTITKKVYRGRVMLLVSSIILLVITAPMFAFAFFNRALSSGSMLSEWMYALSVAICVAVGILGIIWSKKPEHSKKLLLVGGVGVAAVIFSNIAMYISRMGWGL